MARQIEASRSRPPVVKRVVAGLLLIAVAALVVKLVIGLVVTVVIIAAIVAVIAAVLWAANQLF